MLKAVIIDDEARGRQTLLNLLQMHCPQVEVVAQADSGANGIEVIKLHQPDLVFLDVEMPEMTGFEMLDKMPAHDFSVVFTTAHSEHAIKAIKFSAMDYLLKPIDADELMEAVERVEESLSQRQEEQYTLLLKNKNGDKPHFEKIALPTSEGYVFVPIKEILRCEASGSYTIFHLVNKDSILVCKNLKEYEELLNEGNFYRVHHSHLVNIDHIQRYLRGDGGQLVLTDGSVVEVSRRKKEAFLEHLMQKEVKKLG